MKTRTSRLTRLITFTRRRFECVLLLGLVATAEPEVDAAATYQLLKSFGSAELPTSPAGPLTQASDGAFYGISWSFEDHPGGVFRLNQAGSGYKLCKRLRTV